MKKINRPKYVKGVTKLAPHEFHLQEIDGPVPYPPGMRPPQRPDVPRIPERIITSPDQLPPPADDPPADQPAG